MNRECQAIKNFLFVVKDLSYARNFHKLSLECIAKDRFVLFMSRKACHLLPLLTNQELMREKLRKYIIMYFESIEDIIKRLLELHDWSLMPTLIVIDLNAFLEELGEQSRRDSDAPAAIKSVCFCVATLFDYMNSMERRLLDLVRNEGRKVAATTELAHSVVLLGEHADVLSRTQIELIINLYFYNQSAFDDFNDLKERIVTTWN